MTWEKACCVNVAPPNSVNWYSREVEDGSEIASAPFPSVTAKDLPLLLRVRLLSSNVNEPAEELLTGGFIVPRACQGACLLPVTPCTVKCQTGAQKPGVFGNGVNVTEVKSIDGGPVVRADEALGARPSATIAATTPNNAHDPRAPSTPAM